MSTRRENVKAHNREILARNDAATIKKKAEIPAITATDGSLHFEGLDHDVLGLLHEQLYERQHRLRLSGMFPHQATSKAREATPQEILERAVCEKILDAIHEYAESKGWELDFYGQEEEE